MKTISVALSKTDRNFTGWQESSRKDVERGFGVLQSKYHFLVHAIKMHHRDDICYAVRACIAMHNMMVEIRVNEDQEEIISFYEVVNVSDVPVPVTATEPIVQELEVEDAQLAEQEGAGLLDLDNDVVDLKAREKWNRTRMYSHRFHTV